MPEASECKGCGKKIYWGALPDGKRVPLDPVPPCYRYDAATGVAARMTGCMVSHFATCPKANEFSGKKKQ